MVSVIIPSHNYGHFLPEALRSLLDQTYADFECLIIDNGSTDDTLQAVKPYLSDLRFSYFYQENKGVSNARNLGLSKAKGDFILFLDADDKIENDKLKSAVDFLASHQTTDLVYSDMRYFRDGEPSNLYYAYACNPQTDSAWMSYFSGTGKNLVQKLLGGNIMVISSPIFRKSLVTQHGYFDESIRYNEDWDLWLRFALGGASYVYLDKISTKALIRVHATSASVNVYLMQICGLIVLKKNAEYLKKLGLSDTLNARIKDHKKAILQSLIDSENSGVLNDRLAIIKTRGLSNDLPIDDNQAEWLTKLKLTFKKMFI